MATIATTRLSDESISTRSIENLAQTLRGQLLRPGATGYEAARKIWNAMVDKFPVMIVRCAGSADVVRSVNFARDHGLILSIRGGGHNVTGNAVSNDGLMIDLSLMKCIRVDGPARTVRAEGGCTW
jgi:FAD/FMN-containing dehydrogenase